MRRKKLPQYNNIVIEKFAAGGKAIARIADKIVFVSNAVPGDIVDIQVKRKKKFFLEAYPLKFNKLSDIRIEAKCSHFGLCGGCKWQNLPYLAQLQYKQQEVVDNLTRIGKIAMPKILPMIPSEKIFSYRNKLEFSFTDRKWITEEEINSLDENIERRGLGFHIPKMFSRIVDIDKCYLQKEPSNDIRNAIKEFAIKNNFSFFNPIKSEGFLRSLLIRTTLTGDLMVIISFFHNDIPKMHSLLNFLSDKFPQITSLMYVVNPKGNDTINDLTIELFKGKPYIMETLNNIKFKIGAKSFFQTNTYQTINLYNTIAQFANFKKDEIVYDLYTGIGTIANYIADKVKKVIGIEYIPEAIEDAKENSNFNNILNTYFCAGDIKEILNDEFVSANGIPHTIIVDPPRDGMHKDVITKILKIAPKKIIYVSCNSATQARDIFLMKEKYNVTQIQSIDMFPHTHHIENVALLEGDL